ncbi:MAG TPA: Lpg1974 family pore-forming outer membrane protein [Rhabdochlamydiaceae bacterium]|nr:Lpg1974 family pore-forming outer membrane protein [Rhabdochlamydiaceae bacterium]
MRSLLPFFVLSSATVFAVTDTGQPEENETEESKFDMRQRLFGSLEFLYWTVQEGALDYAIHMNHPAPAAAAFATGDYKIADFDWSPGFRAVLGFYRAPHYWEVFGQYTWFYSKGSNRAFAPSEAGEFLSATWGEMTTPPLQSAESHISLHYHIGDLLVTRVFDPNPHLRMRWVGGITTAFIEQSWRIDYYNFSLGHDHIKNKWKFAGGGLRIGITVDWFWTGSIYLSGKASVATLVGAYHNHAKQTTNAAGFDPKIPVRNVIYNSPRFAFQSQILIGPSYQKSYCWPREWDLEVFVGYEFNAWFNLQEVYRSTQSLPGFPKETNLETGVLGFHGLSLRATIGF